MPTAEEYELRALEAKSMAKQAKDVWERETLLIVATQWQLLAGHKANGEAKYVRWDAS